MFKSSVKPSEERIIVDSLPYYPPPRCLGIYVAGKWEEKEAVRTVMAQLREAGHYITYDWTVIESDGTRKQVEEQAKADRAGVISADAFVGVFEKDLAYSGALSEMGMALAMGIPVYLIGHAIDRNIFTKLPEVRYGIESLLNGNGDHNGK